MPYRNRSNVGPTIAHPDPAAITIRQGLRLHIWSQAPMYDDFVRLVRRGGGYFLDSLWAAFLARIAGAETERSFLPRQNPPLVNGYFGGASGVGAAHRLLMHRSSLLQQSAATPQVSSSFEQVFSGGGTHSRIGPLSSWPV